MANEQNLKPFQKGKKKTGGKQKGYVHPTTLIKKFFALEFDRPEELAPLLPEGKYTAQEIATISQVMKAMKGDPKAWELMVDRVAGKPSQTIDANVTEKTKLPEGMTKADLLKLIKLGDK